MYTLKCPLQNILTEFLGSGTMSRCTGFTIRTGQRQTPDCNCMRGAEYSACQASFHLFLCFLARFLRARSIIVLLILYRRTYLPVFVFSTTSVVLPPQYSLLVAYTLLASCTPTTFYHVFIFKVGFSKLHRTTKMTFLVG